MVLYFNNIIFIKKKNYNNNYSNHNYLYQNFTDPGPPTQKTIEGLDQRIQDLKQHMPTGSYSQFKSQSKNNSDTIATADLRDINGSQMIEAVKP